MFSRATCVYVADYRGLNVGAANTLRCRIRAEGKGDYEYRVTKNSVLRRAAEGSDVAGIAELFRGPTAIALSYSDPAGLAKILQEFAKDHETFEVKGGVLDGAAIGCDEIATLATLPSLDELRSRIVGLVQAPASKLARLLNEPAAQLARLFEARARQDEAGG
jgi:large subunit ribosomal protein L10